MKFHLLAAALAATFTVGAQAAVVYSDSFDADALALGYDNSLAPAGWTVTAGSIDLIGRDTHGNTSYDLLPGNGVYIDLDGTTGQGGTLTKTLTGLANGSYSISYDLAGNQRGAAIDDVDVTVGGATTQYHLASGDALTTYTTNAVVTDGTLTLSFRNGGGDNQGALLDNVSVSAVPEPTGGALLLAGLGAIGFAARRRRQG